MVAPSRSIILGEGYHPLPVLPENIPDELKRRPQWVGYRLVEGSDGKRTKKPYDVRTGRLASSTDLTTWATFEEAYRAYEAGRYDGVGFVFSSADPYVGVDLDECVDPATGEVAVWATQIIEELSSYTEISPSRRGVKIFVRGKLPPGRRRKDNIEMYDESRFFTTTGHRLPGVPSSVRDRREELIALHRRVFGEPAPRATGGKKGRHHGGTTHGLSDDKLVERAMRAANGEKFRKLWTGDTSDYANGENAGRSEADLALCSLLAFWVGPDEARIDRLFRQSGLMRQKWERADYRALTLALALDRAEFWGGDGATLVIKLGKTYARRKGAVSLA